VADLGVDVRNNFEPVYVPLEGKAETLKRLKKLSEQCSRILLATGTYFVLFYQPNFLCCYYGNFFVTHLSVFT
jgi:hypothetical protein